MSTYKTVRGKWVKLGGITLAVSSSGGLDIRLERTHLLGAVMVTDGPTELMSLTEAEASEVYNLLGDVMEWESSRGLTDSEMERMGDKADAESGELDDVHAASNK